MARGNIIQGQASGKLGDTVLMVRNGQQVQRVYTKAGARSGNQASEAARIQRVKFGSASNQWQLYRYVCTRMYRKGKKSTQSDYNYFVKRNAPLLPYFTKEENASGVHVLMPGIFSEGNLGRIDLLQRIDIVLREGNENSFLYDSNVSVGAGVSWTANMSALKASLRAAYVNARKVTFLFSYANIVNIEEEEETFASQQITHDIVSFDLYKESSTGEDSASIKDFFKSHIVSDQFKSIIDGQNHNISGASVVMKIRALNDSQLEFLQKTSILMFVTDDNVSDCYTSVLSAASVDPVEGPYALYNSYRTEEAMRLAADSYGYQSGVMRDEVASIGNELSSAVTAYAERLKMVDADAATQYLKSIGNVEELKPMATKTKVAANEDK